jgi:hypothetical protein
VYVYVCVVRIGISTFFVSWPQKYNEPWTIYDFPTIFVKLYSIYAYKKIHLELDLPRANLYFFYLFVKKNNSNFLHF